MRKCLCLLLVLASLSITGAAAWGAGEERENPEVKSFPLIRFSNFAADRRESALTREEEPEGLFESVESASRPWLDSDM